MNGNEMTRSLVMEIPNLTYLPRNRVSNHDNTIILKMHNRLSFNEMLLGTVSRGQICKVTLPKRNHASCS